MVTVARTAAPPTLPVEASTPLGTSMLTTRDLAVLTGCMASATPPLGSPSKPVPSRASRITAASPSTPASSVTNRGGSPGRRARFAWASPENSSSGAVHRTLPILPTSRSRRAATRPSPPLLPLPHTTTTEPSGATRSPARATPWPARSIRSSEGTPCSSIAQRSIARISAASGSGVSQSGSDIASDARDPRSPPPCDRTNRSDGLLDGDRLGEVAGLVDVESAAARDLVSEQLQGNHGENRLQHPVHRGHGDGRGGVLDDLVVSGARQGDRVSPPRAYLLHVGHE